MKIVFAPEVSLPAVLDILRRSFADLADGTAVQPAQSVADLPGGGDVISYFAASGSAGVFGVKVSPYLPQPDGTAIVTAWTLLLDTTTGQPIALVDAGSLTAVRTGATTALAAHLLLADDARSAAIVGAGPVALQHARHLRSLWPQLALTVMSRSGRTAPGWELLGGIEFVRDLDAALPGRDLVALCTSAADAVVDPRRLAPGTLVTSVSTNALGAREIPVEAVPELDVYVDTRASVAVAAELRGAGTLGWSAKAVRGDLAELVTGRAPARRPEAVTYFRSVGLGIEDVAVALAAFEAAQENTGTVEVDR